MTSERLRDHNLMISKKKRTKYICTRSESSNPIPSNTFQYLSTKLTHTAPERMQSTHHSLSDPRFLTSNLHIPFHAFPLSDLILINIASKLRRLTNTARHGAREGNWRCARACRCGLGSNSNTATALCDWMRIRQDWSGGGTWA